MRWSTVKLLTISPWISTLESTFCVWMKYFFITNLVNCQTINFKHTFHVVLVFYPMDFTWICPTEVAAFSDRAKDFHDINAQVLAISTDSAFTHLEWAKTPRKMRGLGGENEKTPVKIPLLADKTHDIVEKYGVLIKEMGISYSGFSNLCEMPQFGQAVRNFQLIPAKEAILKTSSFWPKIILNISKNNQLRHSVANCWTRCTELFLWSIVTGNFANFQSVTCQLAGVLTKFWGLWKDYKMVNYMVRFARWTGMRSVEKRPILRGNFETEFAKCWLWKSHTVGKLSCFALPKRKKYLYLHMLCRNLSETMGGDGKRWTHHYETWF